MRPYILILILLCALAEPFPASARKILHGRVTDAQSGEGLPSAHVAIIGQRAGTITNDDGKYQLELPPVPVKIRFSSIGYYSKETEITADTPDSLDIPLAVNPVMLDEIVVTNEDPAIRIMREVIQRKQIWRAGLEKYTATGYTRVTLGNDTKTVMKMESVLAVAWDKVRGFTVRRKAVRRTGKEPPNENVSPSNMNLYDDYIKVFDQRIFGITHPSALDVYTFKLTGRRKIDDRTVYDISVEPKNRHEKLMVGTLSVLDEEFGMIGAKLRPNSVIRVPLDRKSVAGLRKAFLPPPKIEMEVSLEQQFDNFGGGCWLPIGEKFTGKLDLGWQKLLALPSIRWEETTRFTDFTVTAATRREIPSNRSTEKKETAEMNVEMNRGRISIGISAPNPGGAAETDVAKADSTGGMAAVPDTTDIRDSDFIPPTMMVYTATDSTATMTGKERDYEIFKAFRPTGLLGNYISHKAEKEMKKEIEKERQAKAPGQPKPEPNQQGKPPRLEKRGSRGLVDWYLLPNWSYNRVDGNSAGLKLKATLKKIYAAEALGLYQIERKRFAYDGRFAYPLGKKKLGAVEVRASEGTAVMCDSPVYSRFTNSVLTLLGSDDAFDYYHSISQSVRVKYAFPKRRFDISAIISREKHRSLEKSTDYNLLGRDVAQRENLPVREGRLGSTSLTFGWGDEIVPYLLGNQRRVEVSFEYADHGIFSGDFAFRKYRVTADWRFTTFLRNGLEPNTLDIRFTGMASEGDLPVQCFGRIDSRLAPLTPYGTFRSLSTPLAGEQVCAVFWEHNFKTLPFELARLNFPARRGVEILLQGASGRTWISAGHLNRMTLKPGYLDRFHHEIGLSVNNFYAGLRADVTKDLGSDTVTWGIGYKRPF